MRQRSDTQVVEDQWLSELSTRLEPSAGAGASLPSDLRQAAVLALLFQRDDAVFIPLIERSHGSGVHSGQLALPGGAYEARDGNLAVTALREAGEEVGLDGDIVRLLGALPPVRVTVSGFVVVPFVGWTAAPPTLYPNDSEVASIVELPLSLLSDPRAVREIPNPPGSLHSVMYEYLLPEGRLWGATARMVYNLAAVLPPL